LYHSNEGIYSHLKSDSQAFFCVYLCAIYRQ